MLINHKKTGQKRGFTLIEILLVITIIVILISIIIVSLNGSRKTARANNTRTALKSVLPVVISCNDSQSLINIPAGSENGTKLVCVSFPNAFWPKLPDNYSYVAGGNYTANCLFQVFTDGDTASNILCNCATQACDFV